MINTDFNNQYYSRSIILAIYLPLVNTIGAALSYAILFVPPMIICLVFFYFALPETKNRDYIEVAAAAARLPRLPFGGVGNNKRRTYDMQHADGVRGPSKEVF